MQVEQSAKAQWWAYFVQAMGTMRASYPGAFMPKEQWDAMLKVWAKSLQGFPAKVVGDAAFRAVEQFPEKMPSLGQFLGLVRGYAKSFTREGRPLPSSPRTLLGTESHVLAAENPYEQIARMWEGEIVQRNIDPDKPPPPEVFARWSKDFWAVWDKNAVGSRAGEKYAQDDSGKWMRVAG